VLAMEDEVEAFRYEIDQESVAASTLGDVELGGLETEELPHPNQRSGSISLTAEFYHSETPFHPSLNLDGGEIP
jgi:hypothetical protein